MTNKESEIVKQHIYDCCTEQGTHDAETIKEGCEGCPYDFSIGNNAACYLILMGIGDENVK